MNRAVFMWPYLSLIMLSYSAKTLAWGGRGHSSICEASVHLVKNVELKKFLQSKPHVMGHLCNIPDIQWRQLGPEVTKDGNNAHFFDPDIVGLKIKDIPTDYKEVLKLFEEKKKAIKGNEIIRGDIGSAWWRVQQLVNNAAALKGAFESAKPPANPKEEQDDHFVYNESVYNFILNIGVMGHYVGDLNQPLHNTSDYDGYGKGHGGVHGYYEDTSLSYFGPDLIVRIVKSANSIKDQSFLKPTSIIEKMRNVSLAAYADIDKLIALDPITKPSQIKLVEDLEIKTPATREAPEIGHKKFEKLQLVHLGRAALTLAHLWDLAYELAGQPSFKSYKSYRYPLTVDFIKIDYVPSRAPAPTPIVPAK